MQEKHQNYLKLAVPQDEIVWIGDTEPWSCYSNLEQFDSVMALQQQAGRPNLIVLSLSAAEQDQSLIALRQHEATALCQILVCHDSPLSPYLANGRWDDNYAEKYQAYMLRRQQIKLAYDSDSHKLLCYLWCHQDAMLAPRLIPEQKHLYEYPLLNAWGMSAEDSISWLSELQRNSWIAKADLSNRLRFCPSCHSGHLNYIDVCPQCKGINIEHQSSLHCFNCGHVGVQQSFRKLNTLSCPNCFEGLRHIGVDYDRPIENQHCNDCQDLFVDALVVAECLHCKHSSEINKLHVRNVHSFKLAPHGRAFVLQGYSPTFFNFNLGEQMTREQFYWLVDWQNKLAKRHGQTHCILSVQMPNVVEFLSAEGEARGFAQLDALRERLRSVIRVTDACSNDTQDGLLMLFPMTDMSQLKSIYRKLFNLMELQSASKIELSVKAVTLPAEIGENVANWLTDQLLNAKSM